MRVLVTEIPPEASERRVRKVIGESIRAIHPMWPHPAFQYFKLHPGAGTILFLDDVFAKEWMRYYTKPGRGQKRVAINGSNLFLRPDDKTYASDQKELEALYARDPAAVESDYYDEEEEDLEACRLRIGDLACGAWDSRGAFRIAWARGAQSLSELVLEAEEGRLRICIDDEVIQIALYDVERLISDRHFLYLSLRTLPVLLRRRDADDWLRTNGLDKQHERCAQYSFVYRVRFVGGFTALRNFIKMGKPRLSMPAEIKLKVYDDQAGYDDAVFKTLEAAYGQMGYEVGYQAQALVSYSYLLPTEMVELLPVIRNLERRHGSTSAALFLRSLQNEIPFREPGMPTPLDVGDIRARLEAEELPLLPRPGPRAQAMLWIHSIVVTPTGIFLEGPHPDSGNRVVRSYPGCEDNFLRVHLWEETHARLYDEENVVTDLIFSRYSKLLTEGITIAGRRFSFLAFSTSGLREHSCWLVRRFVDPATKEKITADKIRDNIGDLSMLRNPARFAARMGQAFTTTMHSVFVPEANVKEMPDVERNGYVFSDGVGTVSVELARKLAGHMAGLASEPGVFQIRAGGAKGVVSVDSRLEGEVVNLRPSMTKFRAREEGGLTIEVVDVVSRPRPMYLNRPLVVLLETLGVCTDAFLYLQHQAIQTLRDASQHTDVALEILRDLDVGGAPRIAAIFGALRSWGLDPIRDVAFLRHANDTAISVALRLIKFRARIPVPGCHTLMGILDETGTLREKEIFVCLRDQQTGERTFLEGPCMVTRSPQHHPGDIQPAKLIGEVASDHPFWALSNCVIFSQKGNRDMPSCLAGGDLDGDLFNVIQHRALIPLRVERPARIVKSSEKRLNRPCIATDVIQFFLEYVQKQRLGLISAAQLVIADRMPQGLAAPECLKIAELQNVAVDYPKTGVHPPLHKLPRTGKHKPDFLAPEWRVDMTPGRPTDQSWSKQPFRRERHMYYPSDKALGHMFRAVDVTAQLAEFGELLGRIDDAFAWTARVWEAVMALGKPWWKGEMDADWRAQVAWQTKVVEAYYARLTKIRAEYAPARRGQMLSEEEVFMGCILGRGPYSRGVKREDLATSLKDEYAALLHATRVAALGAASSKPLVLDEVKVRKDVSLRAEERRRFSDVFNRCLAFFRAAVKAEEQDHKQRSAPVIILEPLFQACEALKLLQQMRDDEGRLAELTVDGDLDGKGGNGAIVEGGKDEEAASSDPSKQRGSSPAPSPRIGGSSKGKLKSDGSRASSQGSSDGDGNKKASASDGKSSTGPVTPVDEVGVAKEDWFEEELPPHDDDIFKRAADVVKEPVKERRRPVKFDSWE